MSEELKPCPCCGSNKVALSQRRTPPTRAIWVAVECASCGTCSRTALDWTAAATFWNARDDAAAKAQGAAEERAAIVARLRWCSAQWAAADQVTSAAFDAEADNAERVDHIKQETKPNE